MQTLTSRKVTAPAVPRTPCGCAIGSGRSQATSACIRQGAYGDVAPKTGHPAKLAANGDKDEQHGWQTKELQCLAGC